MEKHEVLIQEFLHYTNVSTALDRRRSRRELLGCDHSELNCLQQIAALEEPNVTALAEALQMTRGAVSKIVQRLAEKGAITSYQRPGNRQKVYYALTAAGEELNRQHEERHSQWQASELRYYETLDAGTLDTVIRFMQGLNRCLRGQLEELER